MFQPPGLSNVYMFANFSVKPIEPFGTFTLGVSSRLNLNFSSTSPKKIFTKDPTKLTLIDPGDEVEFFEISKKEYSKFNEQE